MRTGSGTLDETLRDELPARHGYLLRTHAATRLRELVFGNEAR